MFRVVLAEPEIPQNTGNIGRTCVATRSELHLIEPFGFELSDRTLKRAGLDYWQHLTWKTYPTWNRWIQTIQPSHRFFLFSKKGTQSFYEHRFLPGDWLVFGCETKGLPEGLLEQYPNQVLTIPQLGPVRSLNLANAVSIAVFEALRQNLWVPPRPFHSNDETC